MKKLLMLVFLLCAVAVFVPSRAEEVQGMTIEYNAIGQREYAVSCRIQDQEFTRWLLDAFNGGEPQSEPCRSRASYWVTFHTEDADLTYTIYHDSLYNLSSVLLPDGALYALDPSVPMTLSRAVFEPLSSDVPQEHRALLADHGWTVAFRHPHTLLKLPDALHTSRTDPTALHFTWADLFLRDAGYDITPYLGQTVVPHVYSLCETVNRVAWMPSDAEFLTESKSGGVLCSMHAVVLECGGEIIGAYLFAYSWDGSDLMSLNGRAPLELLGGQTIRDYLLERLPLTVEEQQLAALTPEEVIERYGMVNDPMLMDVAELLSRLGTASSTLYDPMALAKRPASNSCTVLRRLPGDEDMYEARTDDGVYFPEVIAESPETGWKIDYFYNTGP